VTGLPGEDANDSNQFNYGQLREEHDTNMDHPYTTVAADPQAGGNTAFNNPTYGNNNGGLDNPATLNLEDWREIIADEFSGEIIVNTHWLMIS